MIIPFSEKQRISQWWVWLIILSFDVIIITTLILQIGYGTPVGDKPMDNFGVVLVSLVLALFTYLFYRMNLETKMDDSGIKVRLFPFHINYRTYTWDQIDKIYVREYKPMAEYGGWGIKGSKKNRAFNLSGKTGIQIELKDGNKILIGTLKGSEWSSVLPKTHK